MRTIGKNLIFHKIVDITKVCPGAEIQVHLAFLQYEREWPFIQITDCYKDIDGLRLRDREFCYHVPPEDQERELARDNSLSVLSRRFSVTPETLAKIISDHMPDSYREACHESVKV